MKRLIIINFLISYAICSFAQHSASERIYNALQVSFSDIEEAKSIISTIKESELEVLPDSSLFDYHYVCAGIASADKDTEMIINHLQETKRLCETSTGIRKAVYLEIMNALASAYEDKGELDNALAVYQEGIVKGLPIRNWNDAKVEFGTLNSRLAYLYEEKGWLKEVPSMWRNAWDFWPKEDSCFETYNVFPLYMLSDYYERKGDFDNALEVNKEMSDYVLTQTDRNSPVWCDILYQKGSILGHQGKYEDAVNVYKQGIEIAKRNDVKGEVLEQLYGNFICSLAEFESNNNIVVALSELQNACPMLYSQALFSISYIFEKNKRYNDAIEFIDQAISLVNGKDKEKYEWYRGLYVFEYNNQQELGKLEISMLPDKGSSEWFAYMEKLANAYYGDKNKEKAKEILLQMVTESMSNNGSEIEKNRLINLLVGCAADVDDYATVLKFSKEWVESAKKNYGEQSKEYFVSLNTTAVGYIKTNDYKHAGAILEQCTPLCIMLFGEESEQYAVVLHNKGRVAQLAGDFRSAKTYYSESLQIHTMAKTPRSRTLRTREYLGEVELILKEQL